jgi:hypothetical protein
MKCYSFGVPKIEIYLPSGTMGYERRKNLLVRILRVTHLLASSNDMQLQFFTAIVQALLHSIRYIHSVVAFTLPFGSGTIFTNTHMFRRINSTTITAFPSFARNVQMLPLSISS